MGSPTYLEYLAAEQQEALVLDTEADIVADVVPLEDAYGDAPQPEHEEDGYDGLVIDVEQVQVGWV